MSPQTERTGNKTSRNLNRRRTDFSTDCAFLNSKVGTYDLHPPHQLRGRLRTATRTSTATKFDTYGSSQDIETRLRRYHRIRQQGPRPDYNDLGTNSSTSSPRKAPHLPTLKDQLHPIGKPVNRPQNLVTALPLDRPTLELPKTHQDLSTTEDTTPELT